MGKPSKPKVAKVNEGFSWDGFGSANASGTSLTPQASQNVATTQSGIGQYLNELINPSYDNASFKARQELLDQSNQAYANQLGANAIARGARGSATQNILNSVMANRANDMRQAMTQEDARIQNILNQLNATNANYFNQANTMAGNVTQRQLANAAAQNAANMKYNEDYNSWKNNLYSAGLTAAGAVLGGYGLPIAQSALSQYLSTPGAAIDWGQALSAANAYGGK